MNKKYLLWNNKGGVGKTFLSYVLSVEYAIKNPDEDVVVIDACPQTNVSEIILGGGDTGAERVNNFSENNRTIAGYIKERFNTRQASKLGTESSYFIKANDYNKEMPANLYLLPGDMDLDICSKLINHLGISPIRTAWKNSRLLINDLITSFESAPDRLERTSTFFIDCNPSFSNYTENAILAANRILVPCTADAASIRGIKNLFKLIYNLSVDGQSISDEFQDFYHDRDRANLELPKTHIFVQNRSRSNMRDVAKAFLAHASEIDRLVTDAASQHPELFTQLENRIAHVKDGNTLASIINHEGCPLSSLRHKKYSIYGEDTQANQQQINDLQSDISTLLEMI